MVVAFAGRRIDAASSADPRFPLANVGQVERELRALLGTLPTSTLVCSAACGADLLALRVARDLGWRRRIVLPFGVVEFRKSSVVDRPGGWGVLYDSLIRDAREQDDLVIIEGHRSPHTAYTKATDRIIGEALTVAGATSAGDGIANRGLAVIAWDGKSRGNEDLTAAFADRARERGFPVVEIETLRRDKGKNADGNQGAH